MSLPLLIASLALGADAPAPAPNKAEEKAAAAFDPARAAGQQVRHHAHRDAGIDLEVPPRQTERAQRPRGQRRPPLEAEPQRVESQRHGFDDAGREQPLLRRGIAGPGAGPAITICAADRTLLRLTGDPRGKGICRVCAHALPLPARNTNHCYDQGKGGVGFVVPKRHRCRNQATHKKAIACAIIPAGNGKLRNDGKTGWDARYG